MCALLAYMLSVQSRQVSFGERQTFTTELTVCLIVVSILALLQPDFKPHLTLWFGLILQADAVSDASYFTAML